MKWDTPPRFDRSQFDGKRPNAVRASRTREGWESTGISFADLGKMHVQRRAKVQERRLPTPRWALNDEQLRELLIVYLEERFYIAPEETEGLTLIERRKLVSWKAEHYLPEKRKLLDKWLLDYHAIATSRNETLSDDEAQNRLCSVNGCQPAYDGDQAREKLAEIDLHNKRIEIQGLDTDIVLTEKGHAKVIAALVYLYYRLGWDSVTVAEQLGLKSPHVRIVLYRLHAAWRKHLSHRHERMGEGVKDPEGNPQGAYSSTGSTIPSLNNTEPLATFFEGAQ